MLHTNPDAQPGARRSGLGRSGVVEILDENDGVIVISKPAGMLTHPKKPGGPPTLWHRLRELLAFELANGGTVAFINRLDRETSGAMLVAKTAAAARELHEAMKRGGISKRYLCVVKGWPWADSFESDIPLARGCRLGLATVAVRRVAHPDGLAALTRFRVLSRFTSRISSGACWWGSKFSLIEAAPVTGRTHQIRAHLHHLGHPIVGDKIYGPDEHLYLEFIQTGWTPCLESKLILNRQALHSAEIAVTEGRFRGIWRAPVPEDMMALLPVEIQEAF